MPFVRAYPFALIAALVACSSESSESPSTPSTSSELVPRCGTTPARSMEELKASAPVDFERDIAPTLVQSCAYASCHGSRGKSGNHGVFLNAKNADQITEVKASLASATQALPSMQYVKPGDPENSFLMRKLDNDLCSLEEQCVGKSCGKSMPSRNALLPEDTRDVIRRWIAQGAK